jgi:hypothetical protein
MDSPAHLNHPVHLNKATYLRIQLGITAEETENFGTRGILQYCVSHGQRQGSLALSFILIGERTTSLLCMSGYRRKFINTSRYVRLGAFIYNPWMFQCL